MYLMITDKCSMKCAHCCYSCSPRGKRFMSLETADKAIKRACEYSDYITIGGGEPTLHPQFWAILGMCLGERYVEGIHVITNGSVTHTALRLAEMAKKEIIGAELSRDEWHDDIDNQVVEAFKNNGHKLTRTVTRISATGRGKTNAYDYGWEPEKMCVCDDMVVDPDGVIFACGCRKERFGTIESPDIPQEYYERENKCSRGWN